MTDYIGVNFEEIRCYGLKKKEVLYVAFNRVEMMNREIKTNVGLFVFRERERESQFE
jgi:hypothetical protein